MTWWLWLIVSLWGAFSVGLIGWWLHWGRWNWSENTGSPVATAIIFTAMLVGFVFLVHFTPNDPPEKPVRTCTIQQLQQVWSGKSYHEEWVCIGWESDQ